MSKPRLRVFAGPNGSGKSTLFESFSKNYNAGIFLNADLLEKELSTKGYIDLNEYHLNLRQQDLDIFYTTERAASLINKAMHDNHKIDFSIKENMIIDIEKDTHSYEGALISSFLRYHTAGADLQPVPHLAYYQRSFFLKTACSTTFPKF